MLGKLRGLFQDADYAFFEGSDELDSVVPGGIEAFKKLNPDDQESYRKQAIEGIRAECCKTQQVGVVTGHYSFWDAQADRVGPEVWTSADANIYTRILYLDVLAEKILDIRQKDTSREREELDLSSIQAWLVSEKIKLEHHCRAGGHFLP